MHKIAIPTPLLRLAENPFARPATLLFALLTAVRIALLPLCRLLPPRTALSNSQRAHPLPSCAGPHHFRRARAVARKHLFHHRPDHNHVGCGGVHRNNQHIPYERGAQRGDGRGLQRRRRAPPYRLCVCALKAVTPPPITHLSHTHTHTYTHTPPSVISTLCVSAAVARAFIAKTEYHRAVVPVAGAGFVVILLGTIVAGAMMGGCVPCHGRPSPYPPPPFLTL